MTTATFLAFGQDSSPYLQILNTADWSALTVMAPSAQANCAAFSPSGKLLTVGMAASPYLQIYSLPGGSVVTGTPNPGADVASAKFSPDGQYLAVAYKYSSPRLKIYRISDWSTVSGTPTLSNNGLSVEWSPDGSKLAVAFTGSPYFRVYNTSDWSLISGTPIPTSNVLSFAWSPNGAWLAVGVVNSPYLKIYNTSTWTATTITNPPGSGNDVEFNPAGTRLAVATNGSPYLRLYQVSDWSVVAGTPTPSGSMMGVSWSSDGTRLAATHYSGKGLTVYNSSTWAVISGTPTLGANGVTCQFSPLVTLTNAVSADHASDWEMLPFVPVSGRNAAPYIVGPNAMADMACPWAFLAGASAWHAAPFSVLGPVGGRCVSPSGAMVPAISHLVADSATTAAVSVRHAALASLLGVTPVSTRLVSSWGASDLSTEVALSSEAGVSAEMIDATPALTHAGRRMALCAPIEVSCDEGSSVWTATLNLVDPGDYAAIRPGDALTLRLGAVTWALVCDSKQFGRDDPPTYQVKALSPAALLGSPWSVAGRLGEIGMAHAVVERLLGQVVAWGLPDWRLPDSAGELEAETLSLAQQIVAAPGGVLESRPDGTLVARRAHRVSIPDYPIATATTLTDRDLDAHSASVDAPAIANRYVITSGDVGSDSDQIQVEAVQDESDPHAYTVTVWPMPWREVALVHTGDAATHIGDRTETWTTHEELVEIVVGAASLKYPLAELVSASYQYADLGPWTQPDAKKIQTLLGGYSQLAIKYRARAWRWRVTNARTETIQFLTVE